MDHYRIIRDIETGHVKPIYTLMGEEPFFVDMVTDYMEDKLLDEASKAFNQTVVYGRDVSMSQVLSTAKAFPMMGDKQLVLVKEAQDLKEWKRSDDLGELEAYVKHPQESTVLVFAFKNKKLDGRLKVAKQLKSEGVFMDAKRISESRIPDWINDYIESKGFAIAVDAKILLAEYLGNNLGKLVNELNKLCIVLPKGSNIHTKDIEENIGISKDYNVFEFQKALGTKDVQKANRIVDYFIANPKANPIQMVLPVLYGYFSKLHNLHYLKDKGKSSVASNLGVPPFFANDYINAARNYKPGKLERVIGYIRDCDKKSKGVDNVGLDHGTLMKEMTFKILH
jgi:DNA polymerase-3 subunit delta